MPSSRPELILPVVNAIRRTKPKTILDVGCGYGKYGFLAREYLKFWEDEDGNTNELERLDAIEGWEPYIGELQRQIYDNIIIDDVCNVAPNVDNYDLILMIEVLEHLKKNQGRKVIEELKKKSNSLLVSTPIKVKNQEDSFGNEFETHRSQWSKEDFEELGCTECLKNEELEHYIVFW